MKVIITGASKGIGRGIATYLAMDGMETGLLARSASALEDVTQSIEEQGGACHAVPCDLRDPDATEQSVQEIVRLMGGVDALINNAGVVIRKDIFELTLEEWRAMVDTNINGVFYATRAVLPYMREQQAGRIINISSISGKLPLPGGSGYAASKFAVTGLSLSLFQELRDHGIIVSTVYPGSVDSASHRHEAEADPSWKVAPEDVGRLCRDILNTAPGTVLSEVEIRPLRRPPKA